jgi:hypothetical protein
MVTGSGILLMAQQSAEPVLERLDPPRRAAVVMALLGIVLTGLLLVAIAMLGANWARRLARYRPGEQRSSIEAESAKNRQLRESLRAVLPDVKPEDTIQMDGSTKDTKIDS